MSPARSSVLSRDTELGLLEEFLADDTETAPRAFVLSGAPGAGKTTLWEAGVDLATASGQLVLASRASETESGLSYATLGDLVDGMPDHVFAHLPRPQLNALAVVLRRTAPDAGPPDPLAVSTGFLTAVRTASAETPVLIAIDDLQWVDAESIEPLMFAARRLRGQEARFLVTRRTGLSSVIDSAFGVRGSVSTEVGSLSIGAIGHLLTERLGAVLPRRVLHRVFEASQGNPLFALELGRQLLARGMPDTGSELPLGGVLEDLFGARVRGLTAPVRRTLLVAALGVGSTLREMSSILDRRALESAVEGDVVVIDRGRLTVTHPLLAAAARQHSTADERRDIHLALAGAVSDPVPRARHLALAAVTPDAELSELLAAGAQLAASRGGLHEAQEMAGHALRLAPLDSPDRPERLIELSRYYSAAGEVERSAQLLSDGVAELPPGRIRAMGYLQLGDALDLRGDEAQVERALAEGGDNPEVRALALMRRAMLLAIGRIERLDEAEEVAEEALDAARLAGESIVRRVIPALAWARILRGHPVDDLSADGEPLPWSTGLLESSVQRPLAVRLAFRGEVGKARASFAGLRAMAEERGELRFAGLMSHQLCELELRAGNVELALPFIEEIDYGPDQLSRIRARLLAIAAAVRGDPSEAHSHAKQVLAWGDGLDVDAWNRLEAWRATGLAALCEGANDSAVPTLRAVHDYTVRERVGDPGAFPVGPDLVEALALSGERREAEDIAARLAKQGEEQQHPWAMVSARRCGAVIRLASEYDEDAAEALSSAATDYGSLGLGFDRARCLLFLGRSQRRGRKKAAARDALVESARAFEQMGCTGWAGVARGELSRIGGRSADEEPSTLTAGEQTVAELAVGGLSNKEIAARMHISVHTVESHLTRTYAKLGVRSRSQLPEALREAEGG
ncbi:MAG TPA: AAA family ATPase [Acidimicrobiales bacterium]|nr:AAA family ATPase [Acidimicrobiales bacterium]